jgi:proteasome alpha subunit
MTMPFYVAPEQVMKDRAEYAQKGIARGRSLVATTYADGVLIVAENPSRSLHKISEIYDRIAFAGVGKYNEYDQLRVAGVRHADTKGFAFSREDVDARSLANLYAQFLGNVFTHEMKPLEVEILVAELGTDYRPDQLYHIAYEGTITDEDRFAVLGGDAQTISERVSGSWREGWDLAEALQAAVRALAGDRTLGPGDLEVAALSRHNGRRAFRRISNGELARLLGEPPALESNADAGTGASAEGEGDTRTVEGTEEAGSRAGTSPDTAGGAAGDEGAQVPTRRRGAGGGGAGGQMPREGD